MVEGLGYMPIIPAASSHSCSSHGTSGDYTCFTSTIISYKYAK